MQKSACIAEILAKGSDGNIQLPEELSVSTVNELIEFVYVTHRSRWCGLQGGHRPRNEMVDNMHDHVLDNVACFSVNSVTEVHQRAV